MSGVWPKPSYQSSLPGNARLVPDIGYLADPYTGVYVYFTAAGYELIAEKIVGLMSAAAANAR